MRMGSMDITHDLGTVTGISVDTTTSTESRFPITTYTIGGQVT